MSKSDQQVRQEKKKRYHTAGIWAEGLAALWLQLKGYRICERRYKTPVGEIDLIVRRGRHVAFVEVKYRQTLEGAAFSISNHQKKRINKAALYWLAKRSQEDYESLAFDVILLSPWKLPLHIKAAFEEM